MRALSVPAVMVASVLCAGVGLAQPAGQTGVRTQPPNRVPHGPVGQAPDGIPGDDNSSRGAVVSVNFPGGTLGDLVKSLQANANAPVNVSLQQDAASLPVEPMTLRDVSIQQVLWAALGARINMPAWTGGPIPVRMEVLEGSATTAPAYVVTKIMAAAAVGDEPLVDVLSIQRLIAGEQPIAPDVVLTAIDTGLNLQESDRRSRPEIKFHKDSGLILIRGSRADLELTRNIIERMTTVHDRQTAETRQRKLMEIDRNARMRKAEVEMQVATSEVDAAQMVADQIRKTVDMGQSSGVELAQAQSKVARAMANREIARIEMERLKDEEQAGIGAGGDERPTRPAGAGQAPEPSVDELQAQIKLLQAELNRRKGGDRGPAR